MFIVGIDAAKRSHEASIMLEKVKKHTNIRSQVVFAMESTAHYWLALYTRLKKDGYRVILLNPIQISAMRDMFLRKTKTNAGDSFIIAELVRFDRYDVPNRRFRAPGRGHHRGALWQQSFACSHQRAEQESLRPH